jgi:acetyl-CoA synthetase
VVLKQARPGSDEALKIVKELQDWVGKEIGPIAKPRDIRFGDNLPKTRSGKIMRRVARAAWLGLDPGDITTLDDPLTLEAIRAAGTGERSR